MVNSNGNEQIKLLDESIRNYQSLTVPAKPAVFENSILLLEHRIEAAFARGFEGISALPELES